MKTAILACAFCALISFAHAADLTRHSVFDSVEAFTAAAQAIQPAAAHDELSSLFTIPEMGEEQHGKLTAAKTIQSCHALWSGHDTALVITLAEPPTVATRAYVGVLFLLARQNSHWQIVDYLRFTATGKEAEISAELTADTGTGYELGSEGMAPVVTVRESHGGRGYTYQVSASYTFVASKLQRLDLR